MYDTLHLKWLTNTTSYSKNFGFSEYDIYYILTLEMMEIMLWLLDKFL